MCTRCDLCGHSGEEDCRSAANRLSFWTLLQPRPPFIHQIAVDCYSAQHITEDQSPISQFFGLMGLCLVCERGATGLEVQIAHAQKARSSHRRRWTNLRFERPTFSMNVGDVVDASDKATAIHAWAHSTWEDWREHHEAIRRFVDSA